MQKRNSFFLQEEHFSLLTRETLENSFAFWVILSIHSSTVEVRKIKKSIYSSRNLLIRSANLYLKTANQNHYISKLTEDSELNWV